MNSLYNAITFTFTQGIIIFCTGIFIGVAIMAITDLLTLKYGRWKFGRVWYVADDRGNIVRSQFEHPKKMVEKSLRILKAGRGEKIGN